jgi:hypothetical protein
MVHKKSEVVNRSLGPSTMDATPQSTLVESHMEQASLTAVTAVWNTVHEHQLQTFHVKLAQQLQPGDNNFCLHLCRWLLHKTAEPYFLCSVLGHDAAVLTQSAINSYQNLQERALKNPHAIQHSLIPTKIQYQCLAQNCI